MTNETKEKLPVAIYIRYDVEDHNDWNLKEKLLNEYCEKKGYQITEVFRDIEENTCYYSEMIFRIIRYGRYEKSRKLIIVDLEDISLSLEKQAIFYGLLADYEIGLETLNDGVIGEDLLYGLTVHRNARSKEELIERIFSPDYDPF